MRKSIIARAGVVITASALAVSLGAGPVSAAESSSATKSESNGAAVSAAGVKAQALTSFRVSNGVLYRKGNNNVKARIGFTPFTKALANTAYPITTQVAINGRVRGIIPVRYSNLVEIPSAFGPGRVVLGPTTVRYADGSSEVLQNRSNAFYFRRDTFGKFKVRHAGKKVTMSVRAQIRDSSGKKASAKRAKIQYKKGRKWKTLKNVRINSKGKASYKYSTKSKRQYRLVVKKTSTVQGMTIKLKRKV